MRNIEVTKWDKIKEVLNYIFNRVTKIAILLSLSAIVTIVLTHKCGK